MKLTAQQAFDSACQDYDRAVSLIKEMCSKASIDSKNPLLHFDWTLQAVLIAAALGDKVYMEVENNFIKKITDYGDVLDIVNLKAKEIDNKFPCITWDNLTGIIEGYKDIDKKVKFAAFIANMVREYTEKFVEFFSKIDAFTEFDYIQNLDQCFTHIIGYLALCDGDDLESDDAKREAALGFVIVDKIFTNVWKAQKEEFQNKGASTVSSNNSLKEEFKKKRV